MAFGNDLEIALLRMGIGFIVALIIAFIISLLYRTNQLKQEAVHTTTQTNYETSF